MAPLGGRGQHRLAEHRPLDSKSELARLLFGYTTGNGQRFPAQPELVRFVARPGGGLGVIRGLPRSLALEVGWSF